MKIQFWVNDETRGCLTTMSDENAQQALASGFREVSPHEQDTFRAQTREQLRMDQACNRFDCRGRKGMGECPTCRAAL